MAVRKRDVCGKPIKKARNGSARGACILPSRHTSRCVNRTCRFCGIPTTRYNSLKSRPYECKPCLNADRRFRRGSVEYVKQEAGKLHTFPFCRCVGILPKRGKVNKFAVYQRTSGDFMCRVSNILSSSRGSAKKHKYVPIDANTPHSVIRKLMEEPNCVRCNQPLEWVFGLGKTPHLHHDHETGEIYGFTHPVCNPRAMQQEISRQREEIGFLRAQLQEVRRAA
jgi:hypothetical protein